MLFSDPDLEFCVSSRGNVTVMNSLSTDTPRGVCYLERYWIMQWSLATYSTFPLYWRAEVASYQDVGREWTSFLCNKVSIFQVFKIHMNDYFDISIAWCSSTSSQAWEKCIFHLVDYCFLYVFPVLVQLQKHGNIGKNNNFIPENVKHWD